MINLNEYILEKFKINKSADVNDKYSFFIDCISQIPNFYKNIDEISDCYKDWIEHFKINTNKLRFDCTEDIQKYISPKEFKVFDRVIDKDEEDDYYTTCDLDGSREYYIYKELDNDIYIFCHSNTFAVTATDSAIFVARW